MIEISRWPVAATVSVAVRTSASVLSTCRVSGTVWRSAVMATSGPSSSPKLARRAEVVAA